MKKLVIYYSLEGSTKLIAEAISQEISGDTLEIKPVSELKNKGFMKYMWGGRQVIFKYKPKLLPFDKNPAGYDLIFIGTPVWAFNYSPPIRTFLEHHQLKDKKIALFCCHGGVPKNTLNNMAEKLPGNKIIGENDFMMYPKTNKKTAQNIESARIWAKKIIIYQNNFVT